MVDVVAVEIVESTGLQQPGQPRHLNLTNSGFKVQMDDHDVTCKWRKHLAADCQPVNQVAVLNGTALAGSRCGLRYAALKLTKLPQDLGQCPRGCEGGLEAAGDGGQVRQHEVSHSTVAP
jgi:hypothetical protein